MTTNREGETAVTIPLQYNEAVSVFYLYGVGITKENYGNILFLGFVSYQ